jgi:hypothetical protein
MANDAANVQVAVSALASVGPTGTTAPTDSTTALAVGFAGLGWISEDGITESYSDDTTEIRGNDGTVLRRVITGSSATLQFTLLESKTDVLELYHKGGTMSGSAGAFKIDVKAPNTDQRSFVFDVLDGTEHLRLYVPLGEVTERGDIVYSNSQPIGYNVTVSCYPDSSGVLLTKFSDNAAWA